MRVLIVEDEYLIAAGAAAALQQAGCEVVGMAGNVAKAMQLLEGSGCTAAVLDANLDGASAEPVATALLERGIPFLVISGYTARQRQGALAGAPFIAKPFSAVDLVARVLALRK